MRMCRDFVIAFVFLVMGPPVLSEVPASGAEQRVLHFPADRSMGKVLVCEPVPDRPLEGFFYWIRGEDWRYLADARGDVAVPADKWVGLTIEQPEAWSDLSPLRDLQPDDLHQLDVHGSYRGGPRPGDACMPHMAHLTGLRVLHLNETNVTGVGMRWVGGLSNLKRLTLPDRIDDAGLAHVAKLSQLRGLYLLKNRVTNAGLKHLANLHVLEELALGGGSVTSDGLAHLAQLPCLRYLFLQSDRFTNSGFAHLKNVPSLRILNFGHLRQTTDAGLAHLADLTGVQDLSFHWSERITNKGIEYLTKLPHLRSLDIANAKVDHAGLAYLKDIKTLESLDLPSEGISDEGLAYLSQLPNLRELEISRVHLTDPSKDRGYYTDKGVRMLAACTLLEDLSIGSIGVTDASMETVAGLGNLRRLHLFGCTSITDEGLKKLTPLTNLEYLSISGADISISGLSSLNEMPNLRELSVRDVEQDDTGLNLSGLKELRKLSIGTRREEDPITDVDVACLAELMHLEWFQITHSMRKPRGLTNHGLASLAGLTEMDRLTIGGPDLTDEGLAYLSQMKKLDMLNIYGGTFTSEGLRHLEQLDALAYLTLIGEHRFTQEDIRHLFETLPRLYHMQTGSTGTRRTVLREKILADTSRR